MTRGWAVAISVALAGCAALAGATDLRVVDDALEDDAGGARESADAGNPAVATEGIDAALPDVAQPDALQDASVPETSASTAKRVFVSSATYYGALGGLGGADAKCNQLAQAASLPGTFVAWLSTDTTFAKDRVTGLGPWSLVGQSDVAVSKGELTNPPLSLPIRRDERGSEVTGLVWTGTSPSGTFFEGDCTDWTSDDRGRAGIGDSAADGAAWTAATTSSCTARRRLYCFEL